MGYEQMESRRLLAANFGSEMAECIPVAAEVCSAVEVPQEVAQEVPSEQAGTDEGLDFDSTEISPEVAEQADVGASDQPDDATETPVESEGEVEVTAGSEGNEEANTEIGADSDVDSNSDLYAETGGQSDVEAEISGDAEDSIGDEAENFDEAANVDESSIVNELRDPVAGTSGYFGQINADESSKTVAFTPSETGSIDVVVSTSFGDSETRIEVVDGNGEAVESLVSEGLEGFQKLSFDAVEGETYEVTVSSDEAGEGYFVLTVGFEEAPPEPVDLHADEFGVDSTELELVDGIASIVGDLEFAGDTDTFRFTSHDSGSARLSLSELLEDNATELNISIHDSTGEMIARGLTNEMVVVSFDVLAGSEYFIAVEATGDQTGAYELNLDVEVTPEVTEGPVDQHADEIGDDATLLKWVSTEGQPDSISVSSELESELDKDAFRFASPGEGEIVLDLNVISENHSSDISVAVYGAQGELIEVITSEENSDGEAVVDIQDATEDVVTSEPVAINEEPTTRYETTNVEQDVAEIDTDQEVTDQVAEEDAFVDEAESTNETANDDTAIDEAVEVEVDLPVEFVGDTFDAIVDGTTNEEVTIRFDSTPGVEYHVLVDSLNDVPAAYDLTGAFFPDQLLGEPAEVTDSIPDGLIEEEAGVDEDEIDDLVDTVLDDGTVEAIDDEMIVCLDEAEQVTDAGIEDELSKLDQIFQDLENSFESFFEFKEGRFKRGGGFPFARRI